MTLFSLENKFILTKDSSESSLISLGGKARNLHRLSNADIPVPTWWCLATELFEEAYHQIKTPIEDLLTKVDIERWGNIEEISQEIGKLFLSINIDSTALDSYIKDGEKYAVRSSASSEDSASHSFAGQLKSFLYVSKTDLPGKIKECWASAFTDRAIQYLLINKLPLDHLKVAVVIQEMIDSEKSGVMFTADPVKKSSDEIVIVGAYGVGEGVVADLAETDRFSIQKKPLKILSSQIATKKTMIKEDARDVPEEISKRPVLSNEEILQLAKMGKEIEELYSSQQDIEWAFDHNQQLYILQARPITNLEQKKTVIDNSNIVESFPGVSSPMTWDVVQHVYATVFSNCLKRLGMGKIPREISGNLVATYKGRIFYNLSNWYEMMQSFPFSDPYVRVWEQMIGTKLQSRKKRNPIIDAFRIVSPAFRLLFHFLFLDITLFSLGRQLRNYFSSFWKQHDKLKAGSKEDLVEYYIKDFNSAIFKNWDITLLNDIYAFVFSSILKKLLNSWLSPRKGQKLFNELLCGIKGVDSVAPLESLMKLASIWKQEGKSKTFDSLFRKHIDLYGDRGVAELKLESTTFREDEQEFLKVVKEYAENAPTVDQIEEREKNIQGSAHDELRKELKAKPLKRAIVFLVLQLAKRSIIYRENFRLHRSRAYGIVRRICLLLGEKLVQENKIDSTRDVFYLKMSEICATDIAHQDLIEERKTSHQQYEQESVMGRYILQGNLARPVWQGNTSESSDLEGEPCSSGKIKAEVVVVSSIPEIGDNVNLVRGKILVAPMTDPGWVFLMTVAAGLIVEKGSILSHTAIIGRELGIPTIVGVANATRVLKTGDYVIMDAETGKIYKDEK